MAMVATMRATRADQWADERRNRPGSMPAEEERALLVALVRQIMAERRVRLAAADATRELAREGAR